VRAVSTRRLAFATGLNAVSAVRDIHGVIVIDIVERVSVAPREIPQETRSCRLQCRPAVSVGIIDLYGRHVERAENTEALAFNIVHAISIPIQVSLRLRIQDLQRPVDDCQVIPRYREFNSGHAERCQGNPERIPVIRAIEASHFDASRQLGTKPVAQGRTGSLPCGSQWRPGCGPTATWKETQFAGFANASGPKLSAGVR